MNRYESFKELHSNAVSQIQVLNRKLEENDNAKKSNKILENEINKKDKELGDASMKFKKIKELYKDALLKIKTCNQVIDKKNGIINNFINNIEQLNQEKHKAEEECLQSAK